MHSAYLLNEYIEDIKYRCEEKTTCKQPITHIIKVIINVYNYANHTKGIFQTNFQFIICFDPFLENHFSQTKFPSEYRLF